MTRNKMPSEDIAKVLVFIIFQLFLSLIIVGLIPSLIILLGFLLAKRDGKVSTFKVSVKLSIYYAYIIVSIGIFFNLLNFSSKEQYYKHLRTYDSYSEYILVELVGNSLWFVIAAIVYSVIIKKLYEKPIINNFSSISPKMNGEFNIYNTENFKRYSVADELLKWKALKDQGLITDLDFEKMKRKILNK